MDALPSEIHCQIVSYLDSSQLLTCRLVSRYWEEVVSLHLARVNHVILNQSLRYDSPIPDILLDDLYSRRFSCHSNDHRLFFEFLRRRCPNLKAVSAVNDAFRVDDFIRLPPGLMYFETDHYSWNREQPFPFPSLIAFKSRYCPSCQSKSSVQYMNICRKTFTGGNHSNVNTLTPEKLGSLRWFNYRARGVDNDEKLPECPSLEILKIEMYSRFSENHCRLKPFSYPKLKLFSATSLDAAVGPYLCSLQHSTQLRAIELKSVKNASSFLEFAASLQHLQSLKMKYIFDTKITVPLSDSLKHFYFDCPNTSLTFNNPKHDKLRVLHIRCQSESVPFNFPSLQEVYFYSAHNVDEVIDSLYHSRNLKILDLAFEETYCTDEQARKVFQFISDTSSLQKVSVTIPLPKYQEEGQFILDISRHHDLTKLEMNNVYSRDASLKFKIVLGEYYDHLYTDLSSFILKRTGISYRSCSLVIPIERTIIVPFLSNGLSFTEFEMDLEVYNRKEHAARVFGELTSNMPVLKHVALSTVEGFHLSLESVKSFLQAIKEWHSLESLRLDLSIEAARRTRSDERMVIDARALHSLHQVKVQLWSHGNESRYLQLILLLGDFFKELVVADDSLQGQLVDGQQFEATLPTFAKVRLSRPMSQLKSLTVSSWSLIDDTSEFFEACESIESLHLNNSDCIRSLIPVLAKLTNLKELSGQLSHTLVKMFLTRLKGKRKLNLHSSLRPMIEKIQKNSKLDHLDLSWFD